MDGAIAACCPICGAKQNIDGRECNACFRCLLKGVVGTIPPKERWVPYWPTDKENMDKGEFWCI